MSFNFFRKKKYKQKKYNPGKKKYNEKLYYKNIFEIAWEFHEQTLDFKVTLSLLINEYYICITHKNGSGPYYKTGIMENTGF